MRASGKSSVRQSRTPQTRDSFSTGEGIAPVSEMRAISWSYPHNITEAEATRAARRFKQNGANTILTEDHRYLLYDPPAGTVAPEFHFPTTPYSASLPATRIVVAAMHAVGIRVIHHITSCYATADFAEQHRDWTQRDARYPDKPLFFTEYGGVWLFCPNNPDFRETLFDKVISFTRETAVDGWMIDEVELLPDWFSCGCKHCRALFKRDTGLSLPKALDSTVWNNFEDPVWRAWIAWRTKGPARFFADLRARLDAEHPGRLLTVCHAGVADTWSAQYWAIDEVAMSPYINPAFYEAYVRNAIPYHGWPRYVAELEAYAACSRITPSPPLSLFYPSSTHEAFFCWALASSRGFRVWGFVPRRGVSPLSRLGHATASPAFSWQAERESAFRPAEPFARIGLLFSKPSRDMISPMDNTTYIHEWAGWATTMAEANIPYRVILDRDLAAGRLGGVSLLIMPNTACLSKAEIRAVRRFRDAGGRVLATADTAMRDETGALRPAASRAAFLRALDAYIPEALGRGAMRGYARTGEPLPVPKDPDAVIRIRELVAQFPDTIPWRARTPDGVSVNVLRRADGSLAVHLINAQGALAKQGDRVRKTGRRAVIRHTPVHSLVVEIELSASPSGRSVPHQFGESAPQKCSSRWNGKVLRLAVAAVDKYAVIEVPPPGE